MASARPLGLSLYRAGRLLRAIALGVVLAILLFPVLGWIGSSIPRNFPSTPVAAPEVEIMVESNGTHTGIIMPLATPQMDWRDVFPSAAIAEAEKGITHIAVGWGESEVFLDVPTWGDLKPSTAARIAIFGGEPVMRVSHYRMPQPSENHRPVLISAADYERMAQAIAASLPEIAVNDRREILRGTNPQDAYYKARGHYTLANTCNSWVGDMLAEGNVQMGWWTPFAGGVTKWIEPPGDTG